LIGTWWGIFAVCAMLAGLFGALKFMERFLHPHPELLRKLMHVGMGLVVISFPWVFHESWPVLLLAAFSTIALAAIKLVPQLHDGIGSVLTAVHRPSLGEVSFPIAVAALMLLTRGDKLLFVVPMLIMTLADTVAALVGIAYGKVRYVTSEGFKSVEGSIAFFTIAFFSVHVPLLLCTNVGRTQTLLIAIIIGLLSMLLEAIAARGLDNLLIPLGAFAFLKLYLHASVPALELRLAATLLLGVFALAWRNRTSLDDSALMGCALFGYGAWMLGGLLWLIGPTLLFLVHLYLWPRYGSRRVHSIYAVASVTGVGLLWLAFHVAYGGQGRYLFPYAVGFGAHLAIIGVSRIAWDPSRRPRSLRLTYAILAGWALAVLQMLPLLIHFSGKISVSQTLLLMLTALGCVVVGATAFFLLLPYLYGKIHSDIAIHSAGFTCGMVSSLIAALVLVAM
jgi:phytol kinase